jgi:hypothetical protein
MVGVDLAADKPKYFATTEWVPSQPINTCNKEFSARLIKG